MAQNTGFLRVVTPDELAENERRDSQMRAEALASAESAVIDTDLINHVRRQWEIARDHRSTSGLDMRLVNALRTFNGQYSPEQYQEIKRFGGSDVFSRIIANKCRGATALLRDIYFSAERPWHIEPTPEPTVRADIMSKIMLLVQSEAQTLQAAGQPVDEAMIHERVAQLRLAAREAAVQKSREEARLTEKKIDDYLYEGQFYKALADVLVDIGIFPFVVLKGPFVRMVEDVHWVNGQPVMETRPRMLWERRSPFDVYWTPGAERIEQADIFERLRWTRTDLDELIGLPGWDEDKVRAALEEYDRGLRDWMDPIDSERAHEEGREDPNWNRSGFIDALEYHGTVKGSMLREMGMSPEDGVEDPDRVYSVQAWIVGRHVLKLQINPNPRGRHPYRITSFEKIPGTPIGNALPDILADIGQIGNAALRALVNNMGLASGPQVVIMENRFSEGQQATHLYPWKHWYFQDDPGQGAIPPLAFFQPQSNAVELLGVYQKMTEIADEISAIPRHITGGGAPGGAGRTASGLSMLMNNASKMLQQVAANIDDDLIASAIEDLYDILLMTDENQTFNGDENIVVKGASMVAAREAERARQVEFLQMTMNPVDLEIMGVDGRARVLRDVASGIGMPGERYVPSETQMAARMQAQQAAMQAQQAAGGPAPGQPPGAPGAPGAPGPAQARQAQGNRPPGPADETGPRTNVVQPENRSVGA